MDSTTATTTTQQPSVSALVATLRNLKPTSDDDFLVKIDAHYNCNSSYEQAAVEFLQDITVDDAFQLNAVWTSQPQLFSDFHMLVDVAAPYALLRHVVATALQAMPYGDWPMKLLETQSSIHELLPLLPFPTLALHPDFHAHFCRHCTPEQLNHVVRHHSLRGLFRNTGPGCSVTWTLAAFKHILRVFKQVPQSHALFKDTPDMLVDLASPDVWHALLPAHSHCDPLVNSQRLNIALATSFYDLLAEVVHRTPSATLQQNSRPLCLFTAYLLDDYQRTWNARDGQDAAAFTTMLSTMAHFLSNWVTAITATSPTTRVQQDLAPGVLLLLDRLSAWEDSPQAKNRRSIHAAFMEALSKLSLDVWCGDLAVADSIRVSKWTVSPKKSLEYLATYSAVQALYCEDVYEDMSEPSKRQRVA